MKRYFVNQDGDSDKFWNIEIDEQTQIVTFGKINTKGRENVKVFNSAELCKTASDKMIASKIKRGYREVINESNFLEKNTLSAEEADELFFWNSIERTNKHKSSHWSKYSVDKHLESLVNLLSKYDKRKLIQFEKNLLENLHLLYAAKIAELYTILENPFVEKDGQIFFEEYISTDGFIYFRCWLLLKGKDFFDDITKDINAFVSGKYSFNIGDIWAEGLLYAADEAYSFNNKNKDEAEIRDAVSQIYPDVIHYDSEKQKMDKIPESGNKLQKKYSKLVNEIIYLRKNPT